MNLVCGNEYWQGSRATVAGMLRILEGVKGEGLRMEYPKESELQTQLDAHIQTLRSWLEMHQQGVCASPEPTYSGVL